MKNIIIILTLALGIFFSPLTVAQNKANENNKDNILNVVQEKAKKDKKDIMILFSGLEWCGPCRMFDKNVVKKREFKKYAQKKLVFVEIDLKSNKKVEVKIDNKKDSKIAKMKAETLQEFRKELAQKYKVTGVPTAIILNAKGDVLHKHVGSGITAKEFVKKISTQKL